MSQRPLRTTVPSLFTLPCPPTSFSVHTLVTLRKSPLWLHIKLFVFSLLMAFSATRRLASNSQVLSALLLAELLLPGT